MRRGVGEVRQAGDAPCAGDRLMICKTTSTVRVTLAPFGREDLSRLGTAGRVTSGWSLNGRTCGQSRHAARQPRGAQSVRGDVSTNLATRT